jgi:molecular chaperone DnaJ
VQVPTNLNSQQKEALQEFARTMGEGAAPPATPVKDFFEKKKKKK